MVSIKEREYFQRTFELSGKIKTIKFMFSVEYKASK